jgi:hypothetical protein
LSTLEYVWASSEEKYDTHGTTAGQAICIPLCMAIFTELPPVQQKNIAREVDHHHTCTKARPMRLRRSYLSTKGV